MSFETEAEKKDLEINVVIRVNGVYYALKQPDSGLVVPADNVVVDEPRVNSVAIDVRNVSTPIASFSFQVGENSDDPKITNVIMADATQWLKKECIVYMGFKTGAFDFSDYKEIARTRITNVTKIRNGYSIRSQEVTGLVDNEALNVNDTLQTALLPASTTLDVVDGSIYPDSGVVNVSGEFMAYTSKTANTLENLNRGIFGTSAISHEVGETVFLVTQVLDVNPIDFMLQIMLSNTGDGTNSATYDVLEGGLNISPADIDIATFESIRDDFFSGEQHDYYIYNNSSMLKYIEQTALISTNTRLVTINGKISLSLLDQVNFETDLATLSEDDIRSTPTWTLDENKVVNVIEIEYDYNIATRLYESRQVFEDADSIVLFGKKKPLKLQFEGVKTTQGGLGIVNDRATRLLGRLGTARGNITVTSHFNATNFNIGDDVQLIHRFLPQQGGTLGFSDRMEAMSRSIDLKSGIVTTRLEFTSYTGIRLAFIAPSPRITGVIDQKTITVDDAACLKEGYRIKLFKDGPLVLGNPTAGSYLPDADNTITSIVGNQVTFLNDFVSVLGTDIITKMSDYNEASEDQRASYGYVGENSGFFSDGSKSYQILF